MKTYPFDKRFLNFEDPEVLKLMVGKDKAKNWKEVFGFNFVSYGGDKSEVSLILLNQSYSLSNKNLNQILILI